MTYKRHLRLTMTGGIEGGLEQWSMSLSLVPDHSGVLETLVALSPLAYANYLGANVGTSKFADIVSDCSTFFSATDLRVSYYATLLRVKLAAIKEDGHYASAPMEAAVSVGGHDSVDTRARPYQISQKVTLETDGDLGRVKGGFYLPMPTLDWNPVTDLYDATQVAAQQAVVHTFLANLQDVPGLDVDSYKVVIASQGRHNPDGSVRLAPDNYPVKRIHLGRRPDVIRRRANHVLESRVAATTL